MRADAAPAEGPAFSVVIPTYNWSAALRCAIQSVLLQTEQDFEVLVVGDGCTDDSAAVVASFADPRLRWFNLERNHGSQWAANNYANEHASGAWIAYLGHDDIWYPTHLAAVREAARRASADVVTSTMIMYGPPGSRERGIAGVFPGDVFKPNYFVPPSAFAHRRAVYGDLVRWRDPETLSIPMDAVFLSALADHRVVASTRELTCFKFNAAWRRDSYVTKPVAEQEAMLAQILTGDDFRHRELRDVLEQVVAHRFHALLDPQIPKDAEKGSIVRRNRRHKGLDARFQHLERLQPGRPVRFDMSSQDAPSEWQDLETLHDGQTFRWTGPSTRATIDLPLIVDVDVEIEIRVMNSVDPAMYDRIGMLEIHGRPLAVRVHRSGSGANLVAEVPRAWVDPARTFGITMDTGQVKRPIDESGSSDQRWLGAAVQSIEVRPLPRDPA